MKFKIVFEDLDLLVVEKPGGIATQPGREISLAHPLSQKYPELKKIGGSDWGAVHRLDTDTSGLVVFARHQKAYDFLRGEFSKNRVEKEYTALVEGKVLKPGKIEWPIGPDSKSKKRVKVYKNLKEARRHKAQEAVTIYEPIVGAQFIASGLDKSGLYTSLHIHIKTGRRHQIRAHLAAMGHPIAGDRIYGNPPNPPLSKGGEGGFLSLYLHATRLKFRHPRQDQWVEVVSPVSFFE